MYIPNEAILVLKNIKETLNSKLIGVYLYGSAVMGGLKPDSDVDIFVIINDDLNTCERKELCNQLMQISGKVGNMQGTRPLEVIVMNIRKIVPWKYPPECLFQYGEWLRKEFENGKIPEVRFEPDVAILITQVRQISQTLFGPNAQDILPIVPISHLKSALTDSLPGLIANLIGDERNVLLTLARMWYTISTGEITTKDNAAEWAMTRLTKSQAGLMGIARSAYLGECDDQWQDTKMELEELVSALKHNILMGDFKVRGEVL